MSSHEAAKPPALTAGTLRYHYRKRVDLLVTALMFLFTAFSVVMLAIIIGYVVYRGASYINWEFVTAMPRPLRQSGGGIYNAIVGSLIIVGTAIALALPIALGAAVFITEFPETVLARPVRFVADILTGVPSIVVGLFAYTMLVAPFGTFSGYAGAAALASAFSVRHRRGVLGGGQQQRLCIARALAVEPEVLLMDEPCSALDPIATARIEELIHELKDSFTIVIVTHNMQQAARVSDFTAFFYMGELVEFGETGKLFTNPEKRQTEDYITGRFG